MDAKISPLKKSQNGQVFLEYLLLLLVLLSMSLVLIRGFNGGIAQRWQALISIIANPTNTPLQLN